MKNTALILVGMAGEEAHSQRQMIVDVLGQMGLIDPEAPYQVTEPGGLGGALMKRPHDTTLTFIVGGVGAPPYDRTIREVSDYLGISLEYDLETGTNLSRLQPSEDSPILYDCAWLPQGAIVLENDAGPAPGCIIERADDVIILLPGTLSELPAMLQKRVKPYIDDIFHGQTVSRTFMTFGLTDETLAGQLKKFQGKINPSLAVEDFGLLQRITVSATAQNPVKADALVNQIMSQLFHLLGNAAFGADCDSFEEVLVCLLNHRRLRVATAESCTAGLLSSRLVNVSGASRVFELGVTTYAADQKVSVLQVPVNILRLYGEVSAETAVSMATGVRQLGRADIGVGITGIAGPDGGSEEKPVGLVYIAVVDKENAVIRRLKLGSEKSRDDIRKAATLHAMDLLRKYLVHYPKPMKEAVPLREMAEHIRAAMRQSTVVNRTPAMPLDPAFLNVPPQDSALPAPHAGYPYTPPTNPSVPQAPMTPAGYPILSPYQNQQLAVERIVNERRKP